LPAAQSLQAASQYGEDVVDIVSDPPGHLTERLDLFNLE
jgi:hypothetical protein